MVKIRLTRKGRIHRPVYTIVAADSRDPRDGKFLDRLGQYDPQAKPEKCLSNVKADAIAEWIKKGAQLSDTVRTLLKNNKIAINL
jgi:small subunit ribosomal protein S16